MSQSRENGQFIACGGKWKFVSNASSVKPCSDENSDHDPTSCHWTSNQPFDDFQPRSFHGSSSPHSYYYAYSQPNSGTDVLATQEISRNALSTDKSCSNESLLYAPPMERSVSKRVYNSLMPLPPSIDPAYISTLDHADVEEVRTKQLLQFHSHHLPRPAEDGPVEHKSKTIISLSNNDVLSEPTMPLSPPSPVTRVSHTSSPPALIWSNDCSASSSFTTVNQDAQSIWDSSADVYGRDDNSNFSLCGEPSCLTPATSAASDFYPVKPLYDGHAYETVSPQNSSVEDHVAYYNHFDQYIPSTNFPRYLPWMAQPPHTAHVCSEPLAHQTLLDSGSGPVPVHSSFSSSEPPIAGINACNNYIPPSPSEASSFNIASPAFGCRMMASPNVYSPLDGNRPTAVQDNRTWLPLNTAHKDLGLERYSKNPQNNKMKGNKSTKSVKSKSATSSRPVQGIKGFKVQKAAQSKDKSQGRQQSSMLLKAIKAGPDEKYHDSVLIAASQ